MTTAELKPCPFCGGVNLRIEQLIFDRVVGDGVYWVRCLGCDIESPGRASWSKAIGYWNTRAVNGYDIGYREGYAKCAANLKWLDDVRDYSDLTQGASNESS